LPCSADSTAGLMRDRRPITTVADKLGEKTDAQNRTTLAPGRVASRRRPAMPGKVTLLPVVDRDLARVIAITPAQSTESSTIRARLP
jgi:hypothetical protein